MTAAFCVPINQAFFLNGTRLAPTTHVGLIYALCPVVVLLLAWALGQERLVPSRLVGVLTSVSGVLVIGLSNLWHEGEAGGHEALMGDLLLVAAVASWGAYLTLSKPLIARHGAPALAATFLIGSLLDLPIALATLPRLASPVRGLRCGLAGIGPPDLDRDPPGTRLPEQGTPPSRRQPGRHLRQHRAPADDRLGGLVVPRTDHPRARRGRGLDAERNPLDQPPRARSGGETVSALAGLC